MRILLTGATGFIGSAVLRNLIDAGHQVTGMTRSDEGARALAAAGAEPRRGTLEDLDSIRAVADKAEAVIHTAFDHEFAHFVENCAKDSRVIGALGSVLKGSDRPLLITSGVGVGSPVMASQRGRTCSTTITPTRASPREGRQRPPRRGRQCLGDALTAVHNTEKQDLITPLIAIFKEKGVAAYVGEGRNCWSAAHRDDVAVLYRLAIEAAERGARYNAVAEEGVEVRDIVHSLARGLGIPAVSVTQDQVSEQLGWMAMFASMDLPASSAWRRAKLGWTPAGPGLLSDLHAK